MLDETVGREFDVVAISFDPRETPVLASGKKKANLDRYKRPESAERLALPDRRRGVDQGGHRCRRVSLRLGRQDAAVRAPERHRGGDARGPLARYFFGIEYAPRDVKFALIESSAGRIGNAIDQLLLYCYHYDPATGSYGFVAMRAVRLGGAAPCWRCSDSWSCRSGASSAREAEHVGPLRTGSADVASSCPYSVSRSFPSRRPPSRLTSTRCISSSSRFRRSLRWASRCW